VERAEAEAIYDSGRERCVEFILELAASVERLTVAGGLLEERVRRLEAEARRDSRTSSRPPSQDPPKTRQQRRAEARAKAKELLAGEGAKRTAGAQEGHEGSGRKLVAEDQVDEIVCHYPQACGGCGHQFSVQERRAGGRFGRHQVAELPPISVLVIEHRTHRLRCPDCRAETTAALPAAMGSSAFGPRLRAAIVTLTARNRISRRGAVELAREMFGARLSTGSVDAIRRHASDLLAGPLSGDLDASLRAGSQRRMIAGPPRPPIMWPASGSRSRASCRSWRPRTCGNGPSACACRPARAGNLVARARRPRVGRARGARGP
jgi:transposase